ncbi:MAG TPA: TolC family protein [Candidatus Binataceae bacterium]|jgi:outer membrane protein TolC|nr:TolC family protein [Candidatus Binataceae bacterium]
MAQRWVVTVMLGLLSLPAQAHAQVLTLDQAVAEARRVNPQVRAARYRWDSARHQIIQNYTPADPQFSFTNFDSWRGFLYGSGEHNLSLSESFQFPGKGLLQGRQAERTAEIARLTYRAALRDVTAAVKTGYYQLQLDLALDDLLQDNAANLDRVLKVTQIAYTANAATQGDYINAKFALEADRELVRQQAVTIANDRTALNVLLDRRPDEPLEVDRRLELASLETTLDQAIGLATMNRQEILEAALSEQNEDTAVTLAQLEYAPDYTLGMGFDNWLIQSFAPQPNHTQTWNFEVGFNLPIFFWAKNEDISRARSDLAAAREDLDSINTQTAGTVTALYRQILRAKETAQLYNDTLIPLAREAFEVTLVAYQGGKVDFTTLLNTFRQESEARITYLQAVNAFLAQRVALEQAVGGNLR